MSLSLNRAEREAGAVIAAWLPGGGSYLLTNVKVKGQIEKPLRKEIIELTQQDSILWTIFGCGFVDLVSPTTMTLVPAARSDRTHLPGCRSRGGAPCALTGRLVPKTPVSWPSGIQR